MVVFNSLEARQLDHEGRKASEIGQSATEIMHYGDWLLLSEEGACPHPRSGRQNRGQATFPGRKS